MTEIKFDAQEFEKKLNEESKKIEKEIQRPNILVCGGTGAGKSSLINMVLSDQGVQAPVAAGKPVTQEVQKYEGKLVRIYDSPGYESGNESQKKYQEIVLKLIHDNNENITNRIHLVWYCISQGNDRILEIDIKTVNDIKKQGIPIVIVLTQADKGHDETFSELQKVLTKDCPSVYICETSSDKSLQLGIDPLINWSMENLDESLRSAFISSAKSIAFKLAEGKKIVLQHIAAAAGIGASPIPFSDAPLLLSNQAAMVARLAQLWNFSAAKSIISSTVASSIIPTLGKSTVGNLMKLIPGFGSGAGALINAFVASAITAGIGYALNEMFSNITKDEFDGKKTDLAEYLKMLPGLIDMFTEKYKDEKNS